MACQATDRYCHPPQSSSSVRCTLKENPIVRNVHANSQRTLWARKTRMQPASSKPAGFPALILRRVSSCETHNECEAFAFASVTLSNMSNRHPRKQTVVPRVQAPDRGEDSYRHLIWGILLVALSFMLISCNSLSDEKLINAGGLLLRHELDINYRDEIGRYMMETPWVGTSASEGKLDPEQMPDWAQDQYIACVYWEDEFLTESTVSQPGPDLIRIRRGKGWGWVLLTKDLEFHILQTSLQWTITEDGVETESHAKTFVNAWEDPNA